MDSVSRPTLSPLELGRLRAASGQPFHEPAASTGSPARTFELGFSDWKGIDATIEMSGVSAGASADSIIQSVTEHLLDTGQA